MIGLAIYIAGWMLCYRLVYVRMANGDLMSYDWDGEAKVLTSLMAALSALIWPITFAFLFVLRFLTPKVAAERKAELEQEQIRLAKQKFEADERERRIDARERELKVGPYKDE